MTTGTKVGAVGNALPRLGEYEQVQEVLGTDIATLTGISGQTGRFLVFRDGSNPAVEKFSVDKEGTIERWQVKTSTKTADYTLVAADSGKFFTNRGATGSVTFTLPAVATSTGFVFAFFAAVLAQNLVVAAPAGTLVAFNNIGATSITLSTADRIAGNGLVVWCDGTKWFAACVPGVGAAVTEALIGKYTIA